MILLKKDVKLEWHWNKYKANSAQWIKLGVLERKILQCNGQNQWDSGQIRISFGTRLT